MVSTASRPLCLRQIALLATVAFLLVFSIKASSADPSLTLSRLSIVTKVDLGEVTFDMHVTPESSANIGIQMYLHRKGVDQWDFVNAATTPGGSDPKIFALYRGLDNNVNFTVDLPVGTYDGYRLLFFSAADGVHVNYGQLIYDTARETKFKSVKVAFKVTTAQTRVRGPQLTYATFPNAEPDGSGAFTVTILGKLRLPKDYPTTDTGFWAMAKGTGGFSQVWIPMSSVQPGEDTNDPYLEAPVQFQLKGVKPGIWNVQFGLFKSSWGNPLQWVYPGLDFETGGDEWEIKSNRMPPRLRYRDGHFILAAGAAPEPASLYPDHPSALKAAKFVRGGNYGNALGWTITPALDTPGYFVLLGDIGCRFVRVLFNPDRYLNEELYQHAVDQVVQNIWQAGEYPLIAPQDLPSGDALAKRIDGGQAVCRIMATKYKGKSVWIEILNEPQEFGTWAAWKPVAERYLKTVRGIDPDAFVIVPFESWSKDGRGAALDPITDVRVDLYDGHAYVAPDEVQARFGTAAKAGLPVLIGEYGGGADYMQQMDHAFQAMTPPPVGIAPWAFTIKGQDSLPLVESSAGAEIEYTPAGEAVAQAYSLWMQGKRLP